MKAIFLFLLFSVYPALADHHTAVSPGQTLHQDNCTRCHGSQVYTRSDRKVNNYPALKKQVNLCDSNLSLGLFPEDVQAITEHLNKLHYHFTP
jgi:hypothetical protein